MSQLIYNLAVMAPGFLFAVVAHEWAHAYVALKFGDDTAKQNGRLSLNPLVHADLIGTVVFPLVCLLAGWGAFGYCKPVPVNPSRFKSFRSGLFWVSFAGPGMNIILGILSGLIFALFFIHVPETSAWRTAGLSIFRFSLVINFILAVFNLIPFPPLDGSKMVTSFLNYEQAMKYESLERFSFIFLLFLWFTDIPQYIFRPAYAFAEATMKLFVALLI